MSYDVEIMRIGALALFDLKGAKSAVQDWAGDALPPFPQYPNTMTLRDGINLAHIGRDHWLVLAPLDFESTLETALKPTQAPVDISVVKTSDTQCFFALTGPGADQICAIASPLDTHGSVFPEHGISFTECFGLKALIARQPGGFWLAVEQSFGDMVEDYLTRAIS